MGLDQSLLSGVLWYKYIFSVNVNSSNKLLLKITNYNKTIHKNMTTFYNCGNVSLSELFGTPM